MTDTLRLYLRYLGISVRAQMQYRASFVMMTIGHFAITSIEFLGKPTTPPFRADPSGLKP